MCGELSKVKVPVPLLDLIQLTQCQTQVVEHLKLRPMEEEQDPPIILQSEIIHRYMDAPFYMSLQVGDDIIHNCMLDSGASANVMSLSVMRQLELEVHRSYRNICGLDSKSMEVHGLIKDVVVHLVASPDISTIMNVMVVDLPATYGMLLSRKFFASFGGMIQMDLSFVSIPNPNGRLVQIMRDLKKPFYVEKCSRQGNHVGRDAQVYHLSDTRQDEVDSFEVLGFNENMDAINNESYASSEPSLSDESDYFDTLEEDSEFQDEKGKAPMFTA